MSERIPFLIATVAGVVVAIALDLTLTPKLRLNEWLGARTKEEASLRLLGFALFLMAGIFPGPMEFLVTIAALFMILLAARPAAARYRDHRPPGAARYLLTSLLSLLPRQLVAAGDVLGVNAVTTLGLFALLTIVAGLTV